MKGNKIAKNVRCIIIPGSQQVYLDALHEGLIETFIKAGTAVSTPTCGPCLGGYMGVLAAGERCVSTLTETSSAEWAALKLKFIWQTQQ
jgi:3-isopropylmalate/(R)-2-methylmalate dehydratase large subunit